MFCVLKCRQHLNPYSVVAFLCSESGLHGSQWGFARNLSRPYILCRVFSVVLFPGFVPSCNFMCQHCLWSLLGSVCDGMVRTWCLSGNGASLNKICVLGIMCFDLT